MQFEVNSRFVIKGLNEHELSFMRNVLSERQFNYSNWYNNTYAVIFHKDSLHTIPDEDAQKFLDILDFRRNTPIYFEYTGNNRFNIIVK